MAKNEPQATDLTLHQADDFKNINGIKQGIENRLHAANILTYAQLTSLTPEEIMAALGKVIGYTTKRIIEEDWVGQAGRLAQETRAQEPPLPEERSIRQHYATFTIELLLGEENNVRRTRVVHIQSEAEETWAGWDESRLVGFVARSAQVQVQGSPSEESVENKDTSLEKHEVIKHAAPPPPPVTGSPRMQDMAIISPSTGSQRRIVAQEKPFEIALTLDMSEVQAGTEAPLSYNLMAYAKALGGGSRQVLDSTQGTFTPGGLTTLQLKSSGLPDGTYRIGFDFSASAPSSPAAHPDLSMMFDGGLIKVY